MSLQGSLLTVKGRKDRIIETITSILKPVFVYNNLLNLNIIYLYGIKNASQYI